MFCTLLVVWLLKKIMLQPQIRGFFDTYFCCSLADADEKTLVDDGSYVMKPIRVGDSILICGKVNIISSFLLTFNY